MSEAVQAAMSQANEYRVPLVVVVAETHSDAEAIVTSRGLFNGNSVVLSVPKTAAADLEFLNQASQSSESPRIHIFPPAANAQQMQPAKLIEQTFTHAQRMLFTSNQLQPGGAEVQAVLNSCSGAAAAWGSVQARRNPAVTGGSSPTRQDAAPAAAPAAASSSSSTAARQTSSSDAPLPVSTAPARQASPPSSSLSSSLSSSTSGNPTSLVRIVPRVHIRLHASAPAGVVLEMPPQPRDKTLSALRLLVAESAAKSFGNNFHFIEGTGNVRVHHHSENAITAQDVTRGEFLYIAPDLAVPVKHDAAPPPTAATAAASSSSSATTSTPTAAAAAGGKIRMKITFPDHSDKIESFTSDTTAAEVKAILVDKVGHENFFMQFPRGRIKESEMSQTLAQLGITRSVAIRVYDVDAMKERAAEYDGQQKDGESGGGGGGIAGAIGGMLSSAGSLLRGRGTTGDPHQQPQQQPGGDVPPPTSSAAAHHQRGGAPRSMAEMRRQQEEEEEERKRNSKSNDYYGGSGTNTQAPPPPPPGPPPS